MKIYNKLLKMFKTNFLSNKHHNPNKQKNLNDIVNSKMVKINNHYNKIKLFKDLFMNILSFILKINLFNLHN
jgi:hypothetical protein